MAIKNLDKARIISPNNPSLLYYKSLISLIFEENITTIQDLSLAIEISDEGHSEYYFLRGVAFADLGLYTQAYSDFSLALSFNALWPECHYNRAICCLVLGDIEGSFSDLRNFLNFRKHNENNDLIIGHFLFGCGLYEEAMCSYTSIENSDISALIAKVKCLVHMKELNLCLVSLKKLLEVSDNEEFFNDNECLLALKAASMKYSGKEDGDYMKIISSVIEKGKDGAIFKESDFCFYKGVFCFYDKKYQESVDNFIRAYQFKSFLNEIREEKSQESPKNELLSESSSFAFHEYLYNLIICYIQVYYLELSIVYL